MNKKIKGIQKMLWNALIILCITTLACAATTGTASNTQTNTNTQPTNIVVDLAQTSLDSNLGRGDSGVLNLVIKNTGGMPAENIQVYLPSTGSVHIDARQDIGHMDSGESKNIQAIVRIDNSAPTGLVIIPAQISFDGYQSDGDRQNNQIANWQIPIRVYSNPSFQITPSKTTYYKDTADELVLDGTVKEGVKDLQAKLTSSCLTVIGSSQQYIGDVGDNKDFKITYDIKPTTPGACTSTLTLTYTDQSGSKSSLDTSFGINIQDAGVDFKITGISYNPTGPGETVNVSITLKNIGGAEAQDTTLSLAAQDPFAPMDTLEKYVGTVGGGKEASTIFPLSVSWDAVTQTYTILLTITYKIGGTTYTVQKNIGIDVSGKVILKIINIDSSTGTLRIDIANLGTRDANAIIGTLIVPNAAGNLSSQQGAQRQGIQNGSSGGAPVGGQGGQRNVTRQGGVNLPTDTSNSQTYVSYKSNIKPGKDSVFTFTASGSGPATFVIEYSGENNQRITQREQITLGARSSLTTGTNGRTGQSGRGGTDYVQIGEYAAVILVVAALAFTVYKRRKKK